MFRLFLTTLTLTFVIAGCPAPDSMMDPNSSAPDPNTGTGSMGENSNNDDSPYTIGLDASTAKVNVSLPNGVAGDNLVSWTSIGQAPVSGSETDAMVFDGSLQMTAVLDADNQVVLLGWVDPANGRTDISARTTAEVIAYFDVGGWLLPAAQREELVARLETEDAVNDLAAEIETLLSQPPHNLSSDPAALDQARIALRDKLLPAKDSTSAVRVNSENPQSGIMVNQTGLDTIFLTNRYRRRAYAYVDRLSPSEETFKEIELAPIAGATSVFGILTDLAKGTIAWAPVDSDPIRLPLVPEDSDRTEYRVTVVGMGAYAGAEGSLNQAQLERLNKTVEDTVLIDFFIPILANVMIPLNGSAIDDYLRVANGNSVVSSFVTTVTATRKSVWEKSAKGDLKGGLRDLWDAFFSDGTVRLAALDMVLKLFLRNGTVDQRAEFIERAQGITDLLGRIDMVLTVVDSSIQATQLAVSSRAVQFDVTVNRSQVQLTPERTEVVYGESADFRATVPSATGDNAPALTFKWSIPGTYGTIRDTAGHSGTSFESSRNTVTYRPNAAATGEETLTVEAFEIDGQQRKSIGKATALIRVREAKVTITPRRAALGRGDTEIFMVAVPDQLRQDGDELSYLWTTSGDFGQFRSGVNGFESDEDTQPWLVFSDQEGSDTVTVEAFAARGGQHVSLGTATAEIRIEQGRKSIIHGSVDYRTEDVGNGRSCISANMIIPKVDGATNYAIYAYNFNDPLFFGTSTSDNLDPAHVRTHDGGGKNTPQVDEGGQWSILLSGGCGSNPDMAALMSRFAGIIVEIEVTYED